MRQLKGISRLVLLVSSAAAASACHNEPCADPGFAAGEHFQVSILGRSSSTPPCNVRNLEPGDTFTVSSGSLVPVNGACFVRSARPEVPSFATELVSSCKGASLPLGEVCQSTSGCLVETYFLMSSIQQTDQQGSARYTVTWGGTCAPPAGCSDAYDVQMDRLAPGSDGAAD
jgi:hypothetical protein